MTASRVYWTRPAAVTEMDSREPDWPPAAGTSVPTTYNKGGEFGASSRKAFSAVSHNTAARSATARSSSHRHKPCWRRGGFSDNHPVHMREQGRMLSPLRPRRMHCDADMG